MESAIQVDLAKPEAPANQVLHTSLGDLARHASLSPVQTARGTPPNAQKGTVKGGSTTTTQIRLNANVTEDRSSEDTELSNFEEKSNAFVLQPVDKGFGAWSYVASAFAMYIVVWGFPQAFPIFQTHLSSGKSAPYAQSFVLSLLAPGLQDIEEGILFQFLPKSVKFRQLLVIAGIFTITAAMILASYATTVLQTVLSQGVLFGVGGIMLNFVHVSIFSEWFDKRRGEAMGIIWLGYRVGALAFPLICQRLLDKHGYAKTLRVLIAPMLALLIPSSVLLRGRYSAATVVSTPVNPPISKLAAIKTPNVLFYLVVSLLFDFVVNVPKMFITTYGADLELDTSDQALALSLLVLSNMLGTFGFGWLSDGVFYESLICACALSTSMAHFLVWGFAKTRFGLFIYALTVGLTSGGFDNCLFSFYSEVSGENGELFTTIHSLFSFFRGIAILSVGPVGVSLLRLSPTINIDTYAIDKYKYLVLYAGLMSTASGILVISRIVVRLLRNAKTIFGLSSGGTFIGIQETGCTGFAAARTTLSTA